MPCSDYQEFLPGCEPADAVERAIRLAMLNLPHMAPLNAYVEQGERLDTQVFFGRGEGKAGELLDAGIEIAHDAGFGAGRFPTAELEQLGPGETPTPANGRANGFFHPFIILHRNLQRPGGDIYFPKFQRKHC